MRVLVEGWRGTNQSYAMVNQFQLLELLKRPGIALFHKDLPFLYPDWSSDTHPAGFSAEDTRKIASIPPPDGKPMDVLYRIAWPYRAYGGPEGRIFCYATSEADRIPDRYFHAAAGGPRIDPRTRFVTPSAWSRQGLINSGLGADRIDVVPNGVDPALFYPASPQQRAAARAQMRITPDRFVFLNIGAMRPNKGIDLLLRAFARVHRRHPQALLVLKDQSRLYQVTGHAMITQLRAQYPGQLDQALGAIQILSQNLNIAALRALYGASDAYISPYRAEAFSMTPLEAAACGKPIAVTAGGPTEDYFNPAFALRIASAPGLFPEGEQVLEPDLDSVEAAMLQLIEGRGEMDLAAGTRWIGEHFSWTSAVDRLLALFRAH